MSFQTSIHHSARRIQTIRAGGRAHCIPRQGDGKKGPKSDWAPLLGHIDTPDLSSPRTDFTQFPIQHSYLSNSSKKLIFPRPTASCYLTQSLLIAKYIVGSFVVSICLGELAVVNVTIGVRECIFLEMQKMFAQIWSCFPQITYKQQDIMSRQQFTIVNKSRCLHA